MNSDAKSLPTPDDESGLGLAIERAWPGYEVHDFYLIHCHDHQRQCMVVVLCNQGNHTFMHYPEG